MRTAPAHLAITFDLFITGTWDGTALPEDWRNGLPGAGTDMNVRMGRLDAAELRAYVAASSEGEGESLFYVCGPPQMTDWAVTKLKEIEEVKGENVMCEKWW